MVNFTGAHYYTTSSNTATCTRTDPATAPYPDDTNRIFTSDSITPTQYLEYYINGVLIYTSTGIIADQFKALSITSLYSMFFFSRVTYDILHS